MLELASCTCAISQDRYTLKQRLIVGKNCSDKKYNVVTYVAFSFEDLQIKAETLGKLARTIK